MAVSAAACQATIGDGTFGASVFGVVVSAAIRERPVGEADFNPVPSKAVSEATVVPDVPVALHATPASAPQE
eukprot:11173229-Lingulodinium_polyedra.AAC.1